MITIPGRIPIRIYPIFWILMLLISLFNSSSAGTFISWSIVIFTSIICHEMGHALTALAFGQKAHIDLVGFGGLTHRHGKPLNAWKDFFIVFNGPLASLLLCFISYMALNASLNYSPLLLYTLQIFFYANAFWLVINLIPIQPLDGGVLLKIVLGGIFGLRGIKTALFIGLIMAVGVSIFFFAIQSILGGVLFMMLTFENFQAWKSSLNLTAADENEAIQRLLRQAHYQASLGDEEEAIQTLKKIRESCSQGVLYSEATQLLAEILTNQQKTTEAFSILYPLRKTLPINSLRLLQTLAYKNMQWKETIAIGTLAYQKEPLHNTALLNAMSYAQRQEVEPAVNWIKCAIRDGLSDLQSALEQHAFDPIRKDPSFQKLRTLDSK